MILHIFRGNSKISNRLQLQLSLDKGDVFETNSYFELLNMLKIFKSNKYEVIVFHQQRNLMNLFIFLIFSSLSFNRVKLIYDIHDLNEVKINGIKNKIAYYVNAFLENVIFRSKIDFMTVSNGLGQILENKYGRDVKVVYSIPKPEARSEFVACNSNRLVYFGIINEVRLSIADLKAIIDAGFSVDLWGYYSRASLDYISDLNNLYKTNKVVYRGEYRPDDINTILDNYFASLMLFHSVSDNIRYCLPNKLFQSLMAGVPCVVSNNLDEVKELFLDSGFVLGFDEVLNKKNKFNVNREVIDKRMSEIYNENAIEYLKVINSDNISNNSHI